MLNESNLHNYQNTAVDHILRKSHCALFLDMGLGKTVSTLTAINKLMYEDLDVSSALVIAPKRVAESVWGAEAKKWAHLNHLKVVLVTGTAKQRREALNKKGDIYVLGRDNVSWLCGQYGGSMLPFDMLVIDESSSFKNAKSVRFKALRGVQPSFKRVVALTGTPAPNSLQDLWPQIYLLDRGERLGKYITRFRDEYFTPGKRNGAIIYKYDLKNEAEQRIHDAIGDICMSMKAEDYLDLPGRIENIINIPMPLDIADKYKTFEREQVLELFEGQSVDDQISAVNAAALSNKLLQFANGAVYDADKNIHVIHDLKIEAIKEIIEDTNGRPVLIAWTYRSDMYRLKEALEKYKPRELKTDQDIQDWNAGKIRVLMMHPASGGHGLNLQTGGNDIVWFGQTWSLELEQQFNARLDRQGQQKVVVINKLCVEGTIDLDVIKAQKRKAKGQDGLMEAVKAKIEKYLK
jgi:SNF2 family DNA or RNA helicase